MLPVRTSVGFGGTADSSDSDEPEKGVKGIIAAHGLANRDPVTKDDADSSSGRLEIVLEVVEQLKDR
jgi:hypothetical protein